MWRACRRLPTIDERIGRGPALSSARSRDTYRHSTQRKYLFGGRHSREPYEIIQNEDGGQDGEQIRRKVDAKCHWASIPRTNKTKYHASPSHLSSHLFQTHIRLIIICTREQPVLRTW